jgi:hypothetical protein
MSGDGWGLGPGPSKLGVVWRTKFSKAQARALCMLLICALLIAVLAYQVYFYRDTVGAAAPTLTLCICGGVRWRQPVCGHFRLVGTG